MGMLRHISQMFPVLGRLLPIVGTTVLCLLAHSGSFGQAGGLVIIANVDVPIDTISKAYLKKVYKGEQTMWTNKLNIVPVHLDLENEKARILFDDFIGEPFEKYKRYWLKRMFAGYGNAPQTIVSNTKVIEFVSRNPGCIATIERSKVNLLDSNCKVLYLVP